MRNFVLKIFCISVLVFSSDAFSQLTKLRKYAKIENVSRRTYNFVEADGKSKRGKQKKDKAPYIVYSDRENNNAYLDDLGLKAAEKQPFLAPYYVIRQTQDFMELVKADPSKLGKPKGLFSMFSGSKYHFKDIKNVEYVGWIQKDKLLYYTGAKVSRNNLQPVSYYLGIHDEETLFDFDKFIRKDTIFTFNDPDLKIKSSKSFKTNQLVYLYKYNSNKTAALVSDKKYLKDSDSINRTIGWIPAQFVKDVGQKEVWQAKKGEDLVVVNSEKYKDTIDYRDLRDGYIFKAEEVEKQSKGKRKVVDSLKTAYIPVNIWDHYSNKLINIKGDSFYLREVPFIKKKQVTYNFHFVFDCSPHLRDKLLLQISSLQQLWVLLSEDKRFKDKEFTFSASSFGCRGYYELPKTNSFAVWIDYLQRVFLNEETVEATKVNKDGIIKCFESIIEANEPENENFENNIVIVVGEDDLHFRMSDANEELLYSLAKVSSRLIFFQLESTPGKNHQKYILTSKEILEAVSRYYNDYMSNYIIEKTPAVVQNLFAQMPSEDNIYLYDSPERSIYAGGVVFPKIDQKLAPETLKIAIDSVMNKVVVGNEVLIKSLERGASQLGFLRSKHSKGIVNILNKDGQENTNIFRIPKNDKYETYLETSKINLKENRKLVSGYIFTKDELEKLIESYKSIIPITKETIRKKDRKKLKRKYKAYCRQLNKLLFYKELNKRNTIADLIEVRTGVKATDRLLNYIKIKKVPRRRKISNKDFHKLMAKFRAKIAELESLLEDPTAEMYVDGAQNKFYYVTEDQIL